MIRQSYREFKGGNFFLRHSVEWLVFNAKNSTDSSDGFFHNLPASDDRCSNLPAITTWLTRNHLSSAKFVGVDRHCQWNSLLSRVDGMLSR